MNYLKYIILLICLNGFCQQTPQFTQFTFNKYGYNPAAAGINRNSGIEVVLGTRRQWVGFEHAPVTNFLSINYTIRPQRSYRLWHNVGAYVTKEQAGIYRNEGYYLSYALHLPISKRYTMSFGLFAGVRNLALDRNMISMSDPVYKATYSGYFVAYPDFIPGIRIYSKKIFFDVSVQQLYKNRQVQGDKQIGNKSVLTPQLYTSFGKRFFLDNGLTVVPAVNIHTSFINIPSVELNVMAYYAKRIGIGATLRNKDFISGIFQIRFLKNLTAGFAYDYSINRLNSTAANSLEVMIGLTPMMTAMDANKGRNSVAKCPNFDF
ncbi:MAG: PorP/SprF family type IX secretion system membrane protein [Bacteroidetes bacterium]|nr:PorP/SprF family type IX secretion system membrane protein [Bacteroidota bacterium]